MSLRSVVFVAIALGMSSVECQQKAQVDEKCLVPPPNDVDPMLCCKIPELLDPKLIDTCAAKVYGPESQPPNNQNEPPFAPHIRVSPSYLPHFVDFVFSFDICVNKKMKHSF